MKYDNLCISALRALCIDTVYKSKSGHIGMALDCSPLMYLLFTKYLVADPKHPNWIKRDRFVLSAGHASAMLYSTLHLAGYKISMDDLKQFRQFGSITPGHPEYGVTEGVDCSAGPLGQGIAQAVGMAMAEKHLRAIYNDSDSIFSHYTYCLSGDGCLEEGISYEACAIAGKEKLNKLILIYDANTSTLDGPTSISSNENVIERFKAQGWNTIEVADGNNIEELDKAIALARESKDKPTLIKMNTIIGYGLKIQGSNSAHGSLSSLEDGEYAKNQYGWNYPPFTVPEEVYYTFKESFEKRGEEAYAQFEKDYKDYFLKNPEQASYLEATLDNDVSKFLFDKLPTYNPGEKNATRNASYQVLNLVQQELPNLFGGSADVASSVKTDIKGGTIFSDEHPEGTIIRFGIREFAMASIENGILLHKGLRTYCGIFLVFADYMKHSIRMAAMQGLPNVYLFSHDTIAVGEDGPTHQPIEQLAMLRTIPNLNVFRPCDSIETAAAYKLAFSSTNKPSCIILSRQNLTNQINSNFEGVQHGGYVISKENKENMFTLLATGSEVELCVNAQKELLKEGIDVRVVSVPEYLTFLNQPKEYINEVVGNSRENCMFVEMQSSYGLKVLADHVLAIDTFGASAPAEKVMEHFGFTVENLVKRVKEILNK